MPCPFPLALALALPLALAWLLIVTEAFPAGLTLAPTSPLSLPLFLPRSLRCQMSNVKNSVSARIPLDLNVIYHHGMREHKCEGAQRAENLGYITLSPYHPITLSPYHPITISPYHHITKAL